jgi:hypothetical protein
MSGFQSLIELFFIGAFLLFVYRYYNMEGASSLSTPSFLMAIVTVVLALSFTILGVFYALPVLWIAIYGAAAFGLMAIALLRLFRL